ncbi:sodium-independent sulfate anion transporter-like [Adelges cooleyi]|uniref:sodium-independent sulfate anion transporter-like n=1 Tax=Adelges cooleyi TaxID=133065 RepID=UPI00217FBC9D|nr:sodium-independent sulfate anion transporter-like [Adelges cooleyi]
MSEYQGAAKYRAKRYQSVGKALRKRLPIVSWLPKYDTDQAVSDLIAGVTVGLTVMPQGLAYATLAGLEPQYGLYSAFAGCIVYTVFGSCKDITIGPTALMALMTYQQVIGRSSDYAVLLCFLSGILQFIMGSLKLGVLIDFISIPVTVGFTSATSVIIAVSQLKGLLGLKFESSGFLDCLTKVYQNIGNFRANDTILGVTSIVILLLLRKMKDIKLVGPNGKPSNKQRTIMKGLWLLSIARNALIVLVCSMLAYCYHSPDIEPYVTLIGNVRSGLPPLKLPPFSTVVNGKEIGFIDMCLNLGSSIILVPVIAVLGNVAIAKAFASGNSVDATQELYCLGVCNLLGSFVSSMPVTGSFSRSAVNHASGVRTPMGGLYTGLLIILALSLLTPYFYFIPKASLAAVIISAVIFMIEYEIVKPMWKSSRKDLIPTFATFVLCLTIGVELGILVGVAINIILLLIPSARPFLHIEMKKLRTGFEYLLVTPENSLYFPAVDFMRAKTDRAAIKMGQSKLPVVVDCKHILEADFTAAKGIAGLIMDFKRRKQPLCFYNPRKTVLAVLQGVCVDEIVHCFTYDELESTLNDIICTGNGSELKDIVHSSTQPHEMPLLNRRQH